MFILSSSIYFKRDLCVRAQDRVAFHGASFQLAIKARLIEHDSQHNRFQPPLLELLDACHLPISRSSSYHIS